METDIGCTTGKFFVGLQMEGLSSMVFDVLLTVTLLLGPFLLGITLFYTRQPGLRREYPGAPHVQTNVARDESPTTLKHRVLSPAIEPLPAVATASSSKDSAAPPLEASSTVKGQPQTIINGAVHSLRLTINNNALPQSDQAVLISMAEVLQALRADINKLGKQVSRELRSRQKTAQGPRFHSGPENPGPGPWASSNFDHYEYGSDSGDDSGWGTERNWRPNLSCGDQPALEDGNNEDAEEDEAFETQTTIQGRADCNVVAIDLWRSGTEEGAAVDRENETNQSTAVPASGPSRPSPQQQPGPPSNPIYSTSSPESVQCTSSTTLDFTPSPLSSNVFSGVMGGDQSTLDGETVNLQSLQREFEEAERQSAEPSGSSHDQSQEGRKNSKEFGQGSHKPGRRSVTPRKLTRTKTGGGSENIPSEDSW